MSEEESWRNVGLRIRQLRKANRLTLKQLAAGCDLSPNAISLVERGKVAPTVVTLCKIAHALGAPASSFFQEFCPMEVILTRAGERQPVQVTEQALHLLAGRPSEPPAREHDGCSLEDSAIQTVLCVCGQIALEMGDQCHSLDLGDRLAFSADAYHRWKNQGTETAVAVMVLPPRSPHHPQGA